MSNEKCKHRFRHLDPEDAIVGKEIKCLDCNLKYIIKKIEKRENMGDYYIEAYLELEQSIESISLEFQILR